jgi:type III restriction enzyme
MPLILKDYQKRALGTPDTDGALSAFLQLARGATDPHGLTLAFNAARRRAMGETLHDLPYRPLSQDAPEIPQVCIRIPTGGGKTLMAAHAIERAARLYVGVAHPVVLWLVPTNTIRAQTRDALRTPDHPYREALLAHWPADRLTVIDIDECEQLRAQDFGQRTILIIATMQTLRVDKTSGRQVYAYKETFEPHFAALPDADFLERVTDEDLAERPYLRELLGPSPRRPVKRSLANLLAWHRPILIVDEAHNHTTPLSFEVFRRIRPACVIEWTATPAPDQNVLYQVSAQELKAEDMIKLPILLAPHPNWREAVRDALLTRERLAERARHELDSVRPLVLFQAEPKNGAVTVDVLRAHLIEERGIDARRIAVATGTQRELEGVNLFAPDCPIDFIITVEALREGWDCSFAYVFCTVQNIRSSRDMEQLLGRVLRLPYARARRAPELNRAYAHVCGTGTVQVAGELVDRLVSMGFEELEAATFVQPGTDDLFGGGDGGGAIAAPAPVQSAFEIPATVAEGLRQTFGDWLPEGVTLEPHSPDQAPRVQVSGLLPVATVEAVIQAAPKRDRPALTRQLERHQIRAQVALAPAQRGLDFGPVPRLAVPVQGELCLLEPALLAELTPFSLTGAPADLPGFTREAEAKPFLIDLDRGRLRIAVEHPQYRIDLDRDQDAMPRAELIRLLDHAIRRDALLQPDTIAWIGRVLDGLAASGIDLNYCARHLSRLSEHLVRRLQTLVDAQRHQAFQRSLLDGEGGVRLSDRHDFRFDPDRYPARWSFAGRYQFSKHFYPRPGELDADLHAEETACAIAIDRLDAVRFWVRNLERQPLTSFWLPTSTDRFYPDFVLRLTDERLCVVEYKGGDRYSNDDSKEKRDIGAVWAAASAGRCLFAMVTDPKTAGRSVTEQLQRAIAPSGA